MKSAIVGIVDSLGRLKVKNLVTQKKVDNNKTTDYKFCNYLYVTDYNMSFNDQSPIFNTSLGYGDVKVVVDNEDSRTLNINGDHDFYFGTVYNNDKLLNICQRNILEKALKQLNLKNIYVKAGVELEFYVYKMKGDSYDGEKIVDYDTDYDFNQTISYHDLWDQLFELLSGAKIPVEGMKCECGYGQFEINLRYTDAAKVADDVVLAKHLIKVYLAEKGYNCTFMAKPDINDSGSGMHVHLSLHNKDGNRICNDSYKQFWLGILHYLNDWLYFYAPNINSYKRLSNGSWTPVKSDFANDNRMSAIRLINEPKDRFEFRVPGADASIYLVMTAVIYSGLAGIHNDCLNLDTNKNILLSFSEAILAFKNSSLVKESLGSEVHEHFYTIAQNEILSFSKHITDFELKRYFKHC